MNFERKKRNIVWICIDGLRGDSFLSTGNNTVEWNYIDDLITTGVFFPNCIAAAQSTIPSSASFLTSLTPELCRQPTQTANCIPQFHPDAVTIADILKCHGYSTFRWDDMNTYSCHPKSGFDFFEGGYGGLFETPNMSFDAERRDVFLQRYKEQSGDKFIYLHLDHLHEYGGESASIWTGEKYLFHVREVAAEVESIVNKLNVGEDDILIINSDHGVTLNQDFAKFEKRHGGSFGEGRINVFCAIHCKDLEPLSSPGVVGNIDLSPTLLDMVGIDDMKAMGVSLLPVVTEGKERGGPIIVQWTTKPLHPKHVVGGECPAGIENICLRDDTWKYTVFSTGERNLIDLHPESEDLIDVLEQHPEQAAKYEKLYQEMFEDRPETPREFYDQSGQTFDKQAILPEYSILMPVHRAENIMRSALVSLIDQIGYFEILILDNDETGMAERIAEEYADDYRIQHIPVHGMELGQALNVGLRKSRGKYIATASAHYRYPENYLYTLRRAMDAESSPLAYGDGYQLLQDPRGDEYSYIGPSHFYLNQALAAGGVGSPRFMGLYSSQRIREFNCIGDNALVTRESLERTGGFSQGDSPMRKTWEKVAGCNNITHVSQPLVISRDIMIRPSFKYPVQTASTKVSVMVYGDDPVQLQFLLCSLQHQCIKEFEVTIATTGDRLDNIVDLAVSFANMDMQVCVVDDNADMATRCNALLSSAAGEYLVWCPSGAILPETYLKELLSAVDSNKDAIFCNSSRMSTGGTAGKGIQPASNVIVADLWLRPHSLFGMMYRRSLHNMIGQFHSKLGKAAMWDMVMRIAEAGFGTPVPEAMMLMSGLDESGNQSKRDTCTMYREAMRRTGWRIDLAVINQDIFLKGFSDQALNMALERLLIMMRQAPYLAELKPRVAFCGRTLEMEAPPAKVSP